jgi:geranylgeranyl pyrophosphate synthase
VPPVAQRLPVYLDTLRTAIEQALDRSVAAADTPAVLQEAMRYAVLGGGKRLRPCLVLAVAESAGAQRGLDAAIAHGLALPAAVAIEMIHTYSLVHDDLPAMDDDDLRRGRKTCHVVYGDGLAILAGDGLLTDAFATLVDPPAALVPAGTAVAPPERRLRGTAVLAAAAGASGMVGGQAIDLTAAGRVRDRSVTLDARALEDMHRRKTGALIRAAAALGAVMVGASERVIAAVDEYARELGLAFQIVDDLLDVEGSNEALGKTAGKDAAAGKPTYPAVFGLDESRRLAARSVDRAKAALDGVGLGGGRLAEIADWSLRRSR